MRKIFGLILIIVAVSAATLLFLGTDKNQVSLDEPFKVEDPHTRVIGASAMAGAAFMHITNQSGQDDVLIGAKTDVSAMTELHTHIEDKDGVVKMRQIEGGIKLASGETVVMERGGNHVMLMGLNKSFESGEIVKITLMFEKAGDVVVEAPVHNNR